MLASAIEMVSASMVDFVVTFQKLGLEAEWSSSHHQEVVGGCLSIVRVVSPTRIAETCELESACLVRKCLGHISLQVSEKVLGCCHMQLGWLAHGSGQLVDGVGDVEARVLAQKHPEPSNGFVEFRCRGI